MLAQMQIGNLVKTSLSDEQIAFLVGQDLEGHWLAVETHGLGGGIFRSRDTALHYARDECHGRPGAVRFVDQPIALLMS